MGDGRGNRGDYNTGDYNTGYCNTGNCNAGDHNTGNCNAGDHNAGYCNTGDHNAGDRNAGDYNAGDHNAGDCNAGDYNTGDRNTGDHNAGDRNAGDYNTGDRNTGIFNSCNFSNGVFCTVEPKIPIFDIQSDMTATEFYDSKWWSAINSSKFPLTEGVEYTEEEKESDPNKRHIGGYLKENTYKEACQKWWGGLTDEDKEIIKTLPNFNNETFEKITGIKLGRKIRFYVENDIAEIKCFDGKPTDEEINKELIQWLTEKDGCSIGWEEVD